MCEQRGSWKLAGLLSYQRFCGSHSLHPQVFTNIVSTSRYLKTIIGSSLGDDHHDTEDSSSHKALIKKLEEDADEGLNNIFEDDDHGVVESGTRFDEVTTHRQHSINEIYSSLEDSLNAIGEMMNTSDYTSVAVNGKVILFLFCICYFIASFLSVAQVQYEGVVC